MPISLSWFDDNHSIILYTFDGTWTWEEFNKLDEPIWDLVANADYRMDLLLDWSKSAGFPIGIMTSVNRAGETKVSNDGLTISIGGPYLIKIFHNIFRRLYPKAAMAYRAVDNFDEAIRLLERERGTSITQSISAFK